MNPRLGSSFDEENRSITTTLQLQKPDDDVYNVQLLTLLGKQSSGDFVPVNPVNIKTESSESDIQISLLLSQDLIEEYCVFFENADSFSYTCALKYEFYASEEKKIYSIEQASLSMQTSKITKAIISTGIKLLENDICDCLIRRDIESRLKFCTNGASCTQSSPSPPSNYTLHSVMTLKQELSNAQEKEEYKLTLLKASIAWDNSTLELTDLVKVLCVDNCKGAIQYAIPLDIVSDNVTLTLLSRIDSIEGKSGLRRVLEEEGEGNEALLMEVTGIIVQDVSESQGEEIIQQSGTSNTNYYLFGAIGVIGLIVVVGVCLKFGKHCRKKQNGNEGQKPKVNGKI